MTYAQAKAREIVEDVVGPRCAYPPSTFTAVERAIREVLADAAKEAHPGCADRCMHSECKGARDSVRRIDALADSEITV